MITYYTTKEDKQIGHLDCVVRYPEGKEELLENYGDHSPDGFQIGYGGSGPADLAFSILMHFFLTKKYDKETAKSATFEHYQKFKEDFIVPAKSVLVVNSIEITRWYGKHGSLKLGLTKMLVNKKQ